MGEAADLHLNMESRSISARSDVAVAATAPRQTPTPPRASRFGEVLSNTVVRSAESAMRMLPGSPVMAVAVRGATATGALNVPMSPTGGAALGRGPEGPLSGSARVGAPGLGGAALGSTGAGVTGVGSTGTGGDAASIESSMMQSQEMNLYYLRVQEEVNAQNRQFTTVSNLLKAEHDTVKTAIGNLR